MQYYRGPDKEIWDGRIDSKDEYDSFRWHQIVRLINLRDKKLDDIEAGFGFLGFCCDEGVKRNKGRIGASKGPIHIRKELANLPVNFKNEVGLYDCGNFYCEDQKLLKAQKRIGRGIEKMLNNGLFPVVLGGGHETAYGHFLGINSFLKNKKLSEKKLGIINFDAHFDLRPCKAGGNSGTMFTQIADITKSENMGFNYLCTGIQISGNTRSLFKKAEKLGVEYIFAKDIKSYNLIKIFEKIDNFISRNDYIYITICSDVFSSAFAPGVSSPQPFGMDPENVLTIFKHILKSEKVISFDISEVSPRFDSDNRTAKLAAIIIFALVNNLTKLYEKL
ncbi:MAG: formimidoylglutamase [Candidatus Mcinerneyibacterium aminivorans]|uniref:Formimidoylglutamase n=1 Tax=Candidatus Mcinerneyibacterium aminivorans TaxID=2703815 RepID=A0A5D0MIV4_9BACT|nr:MAG: formimidoylglutamase [Candidatus Mcinerneyibacterium aminivorans]